MQPALGFALIAGLMLALGFRRLVIWRRQQARRQAIKIRRAVRAAAPEHTMMGPATLREAEDRIPTIDGDGNRHVVIRTRTLETVLGPIGPVEVERKRRLTLPGHGHVFAVSDTEFEIFHSRTRLRIDVAAPAGRASIG